MPIAHPARTLPLALAAGLAASSATHLAVPAALAQTCDPATLFGTPMSYPAPAANAGNLVTADFNGDGIADLATNNDTAVGFITVLLGDGAGGFGPAAQFATNQGLPFGLSVGDVNGDGFIDIVCGNDQGGNVALLLGNGDGTFQPVSSIALAIPLSNETVLADVDGDGDLDLFVSDPVNNRIWLLLGNGDGTFASGTAISAGGTPRYFAVADADGDGNLDLLVGNSTTNDVSVIRGNGQGQFFAQARFPVAISPNRPTLADLNGNGVLDIIVANFTSNTVSVLLGIDGLDYQPRVNYSVGTDPRRVYLADFTGNGVLDIIVNNFTSNDVSLLVGVGDGTFEPQRRFTVNTTPMDGAVLDANGDGALDFVVINRGSQDITPLLNLCVPGLAFTTQPQDATTDIGGSALFEALVRGPEPIGYQWLFNGHPISGATEPTLVIDPARATDMGLYSLRVTAGPDELTSDPARLAVFNPCPGDFDGDGTLTIFDFLAFQNAFDLGCP